MIVSKAKSEALLDVHKAVAIVDHVDDVGDGHLMASIVSGLSAAPGRHPVPLHS